MILAYVTCNLVYAMASFSGFDVLLDQAYTIGGVRARSGVLLRRLSRTRTDHRPGGGMAADQGFGLFAACTDGVGKA